MFTIAEYSWAQHVNQNKDALEPHFLAFLSSSPLHTCTPAHLCKTLTEHTLSEQMWSDDVTL